MLDYKFTTQANYALSHSCNTKVKRLNMTLE